MNVYIKLRKVQKPFTSFISAKDELFRQAAVQNKDLPSISPQNGARPVKIPTFTTPYAKNVMISKADDNEEEVRDGIKGIDKKLVEIIENEIMSTKKTMKWDKIAGLKTAKEAINYAVIAPMKRPDLFTGIRSAPKGVLLFGPPGS
jgi:SpoVK/Ycf46/Vps4 family AAA+-type ATPase